MNNDLSRPRRHAETIVVSLVGGAILYLGVRHPIAGPLVGLGWVVLMAPAVVERWRSPLIGFVPGLMVTVWVLWAPFRHLGWYVFLALPILATFHYALQPWLARWLIRATRLPAMVVLPLSVGVAEWTRPILGFAHINMFETGAFLYMYPRLIQIADHVGALGLSVLWTLPWAVLVDWFRDRLGEAGPAGRRTVRGGAIASAIVIAVIVVYGGLRLRVDPSADGPAIAAVQPNVRHGESRTAETVDAARDLTQAYVARGTVDLVAWPENAILARYEARPEYRAEVEALARSIGAPILFGTEDTDPTDHRELNAAFLVDGSGAILGRNYKIYTVPFSERRPLRALQRAVPAIERLITSLTIHAWGRAPDGKSGDKPLVMSLTTSNGAITFWAPICYETCYADDCRRAVRSGARFFVNITSEGWSGWGFCNNQVAVSALRAVENRIGVVRVGNTGISCFIRPDGRIEAVLRGLEHGSPLLEPGVLVHRVRLDPRSPTVYTRWGGMVDLLWPSSWVVFIITGLSRKRSTRARHGGAGARV